MFDLSKYNSEQREAILDFDHNLLILACAGSGKTRTITGKIAYAISEGIIAPYQICAVTFTNKAAKEMKERVSRLVEEGDLSDMEIRTFHSLGAYLLRRFGTDVGLSPDFSIYDDDDALSLLAGVYPNQQKKNLRSFLNEIMLIKEMGISSSDARLVEKGYSKELIDMYEKYESALRATGNADFADLIMLPAKLLEDPHSRASEYVHRRFKMILVDEYQDSSDEQFVFLSRLKGPETQVVVVGDDDQSIYSFRGANLENILSFDTLFENVREIKLEKNYRSTDEILRPAGALISKNTKRHVKEIVSADGKKGVKPRIIRAFDGRVEADVISSMILTHRDYDRVAVIYRTNAQSQPFEVSFTNLGIPYKVVGALRFYEREEVKDVLALLYLLMNHRDSVSFKRVINKPPRGIGPKKTEEILSYSDDLMEALETFVSKSSGKAKEASFQFLSTWKSLTKLLDEGQDVNIGSVAHRAFVEFGLSDYYKSEPDSSIRSSKLQNVEQLINALSEEGSGRDKLRAFLERVALDNTILGSEDPRDKEGVTLITMHNAKGLEFDTVYCVGLEDDTIPGTDVTSEEAEEERRLLYVAMTRAQRCLVLSHADSRFKWGSVFYSKPSRFLEDIPREYLEGDFSDLDKRQNFGTSSSYTSWKGQSWANGIDFSPRKMGYTPSVRRSPLKSQSFNIGEKVKSATYGTGEVVDIKDEGERRILTVLFGEKRVKYVEAKAALEKI